MRASGSPRLARTVPSGSTRTAAPRCRDSTMPERSSTASSTEPEAVNTSAIDLEGSERLIEHCESFSDEVVAQGETRQEPQHIAVGSGGEHQDALLGGGGGDRVDGIRSGLVGLGV